MATMAENFSCVMVLKVNVAVMLKHKQFITDLREHKIRDNGHRDETKRGK